MLIFPSQLTIFFVPNCSLNSVLTVNVIYSILHNSNHCLETRHVELLMTGNAAQKDSVVNIYRPDRVLGGIKLCLVIKLIVHILLKL